MNCFFSMAGFFLSDRKPAVLMLLNFEFVSLPPLLVSHVSCQPGHLFLSLIFTHTHLDTQIRFAMFQKVKKGQITKQNCQNKSKKIYNIIQVLLKQALKVTIFFNIKKSQIGQSILLKNTFQKRSNSNPETNVKHTLNSLFLEMSLVILSSVPV
jgi:hypothetical protein